MKVKQTGAEGSDVVSGKKESRMTDVSALRNRKDGAFFPPTFPFSHPLPGAAPWFMARSFLKRCRAS